MKTNIQFTLERYDVELFRDRWAWEGAAGLLDRCALIATTIICAITLWVIYAQPWSPLQVFWFGLGVVTIWQTTLYLLRHGWLRRQPKILSLPYMIRQTLVSGAPAETGLVIQVATGEAGITIATDVWEAYYSWLEIQRVEIVRTDDILLVRATHRSWSREVSIPLFLIPRRAFSLPGGMEAFAERCEEFKSAVRRSEANKDNAGRIIHRRVSNGVVFYPLLTVACFLLWWLMLILIGNVL